MRRILSLLSAACAAGCAASASSPPAASPERDAPTADSVRHEHASVDLTGAWATGTAAEPAVERMALRVECNYSPSLWLIQQNGDTARLWVIPASYSQGIATARPSSTTSPAKGRVSGVELTMDNPGARYVLRYDSTSGHLRGTLNGAPFWAIRQDIVRAENCIPVP